MGIVAILALGVGLAQAPAASAASGAIDAGGQEARVCRRMPVTGSYVRFTRRCYTRAEWDRIAEAARANTQDMQDRNRGTFN